MIDGQWFHQGLLLIQHFVSLVGVLTIVTGVLIALSHYTYYLMTDKILGAASPINEIRLNLGRILILGLEFIVASDLIGTTTAPDYYSLGLLGIIVVIRTLLNYSLNKEINSLKNES